MLIRLTIALLLCSCADLGEVAGDAVGVSWRWTWEVRAVCADGRRDPLDGGEVCTDDVGAWLDREIPNPYPIPADACGGRDRQVGVVEAALEPDDFGWCE